MKNAFSSRFESTLKKMHWPSKDLALDQALGQEWTEGVAQLLELQEPELKSREKSVTSSKHYQEAIVLLPLEAMVKTLELRFKYHFEGDKPTNRLDKVSCASAIIELPLIIVARVFPLPYRRSSQYLRGILHYISSTNSVGTLQRNEPVTEPSIYRLDIGAYYCRASNAATEDPQLPTANSRTAPIVEPFHARINEF